MFTRVNGNLLHTVSFGQGASTVVAHGGWVGSWELWQQPFELLSPAWRCISYDHRGTGESVVPVAAITPEALVADLFGVLDAYEVTRCVLAAESMGAIVALTAVLRQPDRFDGLVLVGGAPGITEASARPLVDGARRDYPATVRSFVRACVPESGSDHLHRWGEHLLARAGAEAAARLFECYLESGQPPIPLADVAVPTLVIHGTDDAIVPVSIATWVAGTIPGAELVLLDGAGHVPTMTRPHDIATAIEARFGR